MRLTSFVMQATRTDASAYLSRQVDASRLFFLEVDPLAEFAVVFGGFERCGADYQIDRSGVPWLVLEFVQGGSGTLVLAGREHHLSAGSCYLYGPGISHRIESHSSQPLRKYFVGFTGAAAVEFLEEHQLSPGTVVRCLKADPIRWAFESLIERGVRKSRLAVPLAELLTRQLLLMCRDDAVDSADLNSITYATYLRSRQWIEEHFLECTTLAHVAAGFGISAAYLCRIFARYHNESPYAFLLRLRMEYASRLLLEPETSVKSVALDLGYRDVAHFSRVFKATHHVPPSRFRQSNHPQWLTVK